MTTLHWIGFIVLVVVLFGLTRRGKGGRTVVRASDLRVIDGDTVWLADRNGAILEKMRLATIDAPETRGLKSLWQHTAGERAKEALRRALQEAGEIEIVRLDTDRFDRTLVRLYDARRRGREIGLRLADAGHARYWD